MTTKTGTLIRWASADVVLMVAACMLPALSHAVALPLYRLNPMLALMLTGIVVGRDWRNGLLLAVFMPVVSCLLVGMPTAPKMVCMMAELAMVATLFGWLQRKWAVLPAVLAAVLAGKAVYYALKALIVVPAVLVGTDWRMQLGAAVVWCGLFAMLYKKTR